MSRPGESAVRINGEPAETVSYLDRGLLYGDGVFETLIVREGRPVRWERHLARLRRGLERLQIPFTDFAPLQAEVLDMAGRGNLGVVKVLISRGMGARGYAPPGRPEPTRIVSLHPMPETPASHYREGVTLCWCETRLGINPRLAGIKHLNRLEQVLARAEWSDADISEGLMQDTEGRVVAGTASNLFLVRKGQLLTPGVHRCGVAGVTRAVIMDLAASWNIPVQETDILPRQVHNAEALFLSNSVIGIWPVARLLGGTGKASRYPVDALTQNLMQALDKTP